MKVPPPNVFGMEISGDLGQLVLTVIGAVIALPLLTMLLLGPFGKNLRSLAGNEIGARAFGISVEEHLIAAFVISSAILAFAAILSAPQSRILDPDSFGLFASIAALAYPIVGGMGSLWGGLIGGAAMRALPELLRPVADYAELVLSAIVLAVILLAPGGLVALCQGMFGQRRRAADDVRTEPIETPLASVAVGRDAVDASPVSALSIHNVSVAYDALRAVDDTSLTVPAGTIYGVMGPNGAGKTTLFNLISGFIAPSSGRIYFFGAPLLAAAAHHRIALGISRTFQHVAIFPQLTCRDNVVIGLGANRIGMVLARSFNAAIAGTTSRRETASAERALEAVGLGHYCAAPAGSLSLGDQRRLEIARAIVSKPRLILLDEPVSGLTNDEVAQIGALLRRINRELGVTILIVEHNIGFLLDVCDQLSVMGQGRVVAEGSPDRVVATPEVRRIYFGESRVE
jgi:branched-chain amino acid transport system permease protein